MMLTADLELLTDADAVIIAVPTPVDERRQPDLRPLRGACETVVATPASGQTIILTSTTSIGSTRELLVEPLERRGLTARRATSSSRSPPSASTRASRPTPSCRRPASSAAPPRSASSARPRCCATPARFIHAVSSTEAAEMAKLMENTFRATNIALAIRVRRGRAAQRPGRRRGHRRRQHQALRVHGALPVRRRRRALHPGGPLLPARAAARRRRAPAGHRRVDGAGVQAPAGASRSAR